MSEVGGPKVIQWPGPSWGPMVLTRPMLVPLRRPRRLLLDEPRSLTGAELAWLRTGLGYVGTDLKWMIRLTGINELHLVRSWTGLERYRATVSTEHGTARIAEVLVPDDGASDEAAAAAFLRSLDSLLRLGERLPGVPEHPALAIAATATGTPPWGADLPTFVAAIKSVLPLRVHRMRVGDESADVDIDIVDVVVDADSVLLLSADGGRIWITHPWRWTAADDGIRVGVARVLVWPGPDWGLDPNLAAWASWLPEVGIASRKLDWKGKEIPAIDNFQNGMIDLVLDLTGQSSSTPDRVRQLADQIAATGRRVSAIGDEEFGDLRINGDTRVIIASVADGASTTMWDRLSETIGPFRETAAADRVLADFSIHGPFERDVMREGGLLWIRVRVRLADVTTAFMDLDNVVALLGGALSDADGSGDDHVE